jgi:hypothetical protein
MQTKKGWGWNDETKEIEVNKKDLDDIDKFMKPIEKYYSELELAREELLNG